MAAHSTVAGGRRLHYWKLASLLLAGAALAACTSSDGGGSASPSGGQSPDPVVLDFPIAYVKRPVPADTAMSPDARELLPFQPGSDLYLRDRAAPSCGRAQPHRGDHQGHGRRA